MTQRPAPTFITPLAAAAVILIAACGGGSDEDTPAPSATVAAPTASSTPSAKANGASPLATPRPSVEYIVKTGDTLWGIADGFGVTVAVLRNANPWIVDDFLSIGDVILVPGASEGDGGSVAATPSSTQGGGEVVGSVTLLTVVDKQHALPSGYFPGDLVGIDGRWVAPGTGSQSLRAEAAGALLEILGAAEAEGIEVLVQSSFRSYETQIATYQNHVDTLGQEQASRISARPGHSEHQLGTTADLTSAGVGYDLTESFASTPAGEWLLANAYRYGFALSYPAGKESITGYAHEPWHYRYVGVADAGAWHDSGLTLVEYLGGR